MNKPPGRRNAELEAWDRELKGDAGEAEEAAQPIGPGPAEAVDSGPASPPDGAPGQEGPPSAAAGGPPASQPRRPADEEADPGAHPAPWDAREEGVTTEVLLRDLIIFQVKLLLDGLKDVVLSPLAIAAVLWDLVPSRNAPRGRAFYQILKVGERFDLWLNLYNPSHAQRQDHEGLLEAGVHSADSLMGKLEQLARAEAEKQSRGRKGKGHHDLEA